MTSKNGIVSLPFYSFCEQDKGPGVFPEGWGPPV